MEAVSLPRRPTLPPTYEAASASSQTIVESDVESLKIADHEPLPRVRSKTEEPHPSNYCLPRPHRNNIETLSVTSRATTRRWRWNPFRSSGNTPPAITDDAASIASSRSSGLRGRAPREMVHLGHNLTPFLQSRPVDRYDPAAEYFDFVKVTNVDADEKHGKNHDEKRSVYDVAELADSSTATLHFEMPVERVLYPQLSMEERPRHAEPSAPPIQMPKQLYQQQSPQQLQRPRSVRPLFSRSRSTSVTADEELSALCHYKEEIETYLSSRRSTPSSEKWVKAIVTLEGGDVVLKGTVAGLELKRFSLRRNPKVYSRGFNCGRRENVVRLEFDGGNAIMLQFQSGAEQEFWFKELEASRQRLLQSK